MSSLLLAPAVVGRQGLSLAAPFSSDPFSLGVASGDPDSRSVVLWTRLAPAPLDEDGGMPAEPVTVEWSVASDEAMSKVVARGEVATTAAEGHSVHVVAEGLSPGRHHWYQFRAAGAVSAKGRTKTLPARGDDVAAFDLAVAGCQLIDHGFYTAWSDVATS
jgi:alkaline phosphatase D